MRIPAFVFLALLTIATQACSSKQVYEGIQAGQRNACQKYQEPERSRCLESTDVRYEDYRKATENPP